MSTSPILKPATIDDLERLVTAFADGARAQHLLVSGGFGSGKSHALGVAALAGGASGARVSWLGRGAIGVSSYTDFLTAVVDAGATGEFATEQLSRQIDDDDITALEELALHGRGAAHPLVIVVEGLDQLIRQMRAADRPRMMQLLERASGPLVVGSTIGSALNEDFARHFTMVSTRPVRDVSEGIGLAVTRAERRRLISRRDVEQLEVDSARLDRSALASPLFWSIVGGHLEVSGRGAIERARDDLHALVRAHFDALLLRIAPSEQRVLVEIARAGAPRTVQQVADGIAVRNQAAASALARLHSDGWVVTPDRPDGADRRKTWYDIADPLLRMHLRPGGTDSVGEIIRSFVETWSAAPLRTPASVAPRALRQDEHLATRRGENGEADVARQWFQESVLTEVENGGLRSADAVGAFWGWAIWTANSGDRQRAQQMLESALSDTEALFGVTSREALEATFHVAWNLTERGQLAGAQAHYENVLSTAVSVGDPGLAARARQDLGRVLGEQGSPEAAVEEMTAAIRQMQRLGAEPGPEADAWATRIRRARHGLGVWLAKSGRIREAIDVLDTVIDDHRTSEYDRHHVQFARADVMARLDLEAARNEFETLASDIEANGLDTELARRARSRALDLAILLDPVSPATWPIGRVDPDLLSESLSALLGRGELDTHQLSAVFRSCTPAQLRWLAASLIATPGEIPPAVRAERARAIAPFIRGAREQNLLIDLADALTENPSAEANLPEEWRDMLVTMRAHDPLPYP